MKNTLKKLALYALIGCFVAGSMTFILWWNLRSAGLGIQYAAVDGGLALKRYSGTSEDKRLVVPDFSDGQAVVALGEFSISNAAYLEELYIGANVRDMHPWALTNCERLRRIDVDPANAYFTSADGVLYNHDKTELVLFPNMHGEVFAVPGGVCAIGENAFYKCKNLQEIAFPSTLREVGERAFFRCSGLKELQLPEGLEIIGVDAFAFCDALEGDIIIPATCREIRDYAFSSKSSKISKIIILADKEKIALANDWLPLKEKKASAKVGFEFAGGVR